MKFKLWLCSRHFKELWEGRYTKRKKVGNHFTFGILKHWYTIDQYSSASEQMCDSCFAENTKMVRTTVVFSTYKVEIEI